VAASKSPAAMKLKIVFEVVFMKNLPDTSLKHFISSLPCIDLIKDRPKERHGQALQKNMSAWTLFASDLMKLKKFRQYSECIQTDIAQPLHE
jgi:hypothetical protein